jgi:hypothetical protein
MTADRRQQLEVRLLKVLKELEQQPHVSHSYPPNRLSFPDEMKQIREYIEVAGEYGLAYDLIVAELEVHPFVLSGKAAISLLELGLLIGYKSDEEKDGVFDRRNNPK